MPEKSRDSGFTLNELLIVIVILGVLAGIVVFAIGTMTDDSIDVACRTDKQQVVLAVGAYRHQLGSYPTDVADLVPVYLKEVPVSATFTISTEGEVTADIC